MLFGKFARDSVWCICMYVLAFFYYSLHFPCIVSTALQCFRSKQFIKSKFYCFQFNRRRRHTQQKNSVLLYIIYQSTFTNSFFLRYEITVAIGSSYSTEFVPWQLSTIQPESSINEWTRLHSRYIRTTDTTNTHSIHNRTVRCLLVVVCSYCKHNLGQQFMHMVAATFAKLLLARKQKMFKMPMRITTTGSSDACWTVIQITFYTFLQTR